MVERSREIKVTLTVKRNSNLALITSSTLGSWMNGWHVKYQCKRCGRCKKGVDWGGVGGRC